MQYIIENVFPNLATYRALKDEIVKSSSLIELNKGEVLLKAGSYIKAIPFLVSGLIKVFKEDESGAEVLLYYIEPGQSCVMSMTTLVKAEHSNVKAVVEKDAQLIVIPANIALDIAKKFPKWNDFFYDLFSSKFNELLHRIEVITFSNKDRLLLEYLIKEAKVSNCDTIKLTHQQIANELGSSREVISRLLKKLEQENAIILHQGSITVV